MTLLALVVAAGSAGGGAANNNKAAGTTTNPRQTSDSKSGRSGINDELYCYRTVEETFATMDEFATLYSNLVTVKTIGQSYLKQEGQPGGYDIPVMIITAPTPPTSASSSSNNANANANASANNNNILEKVNMMIVGGHHSRELPPPETLMRWAQHLLEQYGTDADITWILQRTQIHIVPISNPDGRQIVQDHLDWLYRKNARPNECNPGGAFGFGGGGNDQEKYWGVDLNRNYPFFYGDDSGSSSNPCATDYRGPYALSEPESNAIYRYASNLFPKSMKKGSASLPVSKSGKQNNNNNNNNKQANNNLLYEDAILYRDVACPTNATGLFLDVHSAGDFVYFPWGFEDSLAPNHHALLTLASKLAHPGQYTLWGPRQDGFLYYVSGDVTDAMYGIDCVAALGYELGSEFYASCTELETSIVPTMFQSLLYASKCVTAPYTIPLGPDIITIEVDIEQQQEPQEHFEGTTTITKNNNNNNNNDRTILQLRVEVSDDALIVPYANFEEEKSHNIAKVQVFLDIHPYDVDEQQQQQQQGSSESTSRLSWFWDMEPQDGAFDSPNEIAIYTLDLTDHLHNGGEGQGNGQQQQQHVLYFQATDSAGFTGPVSAQFIDINTASTASESTTAATTLNPTTTTTTLSPSSKDIPTGSPSREPTIAVVYTQTLQPSNSQQQQPTSTPTTMMEGTTMRPTTSLDNENNNDNVSEDATENPTLSPTSLLTTSPSESTASTTTLTPISLGLGNEGGDGDSSTSTSEDEAIVNGSHDDGDNDFVVTIGQGGGNSNDDQAPNNDNNNVFDHDGSNNGVITDDSDQEEGTSNNNINQTIPTTSNTSIATTTPPVTNNNNNEDRHENTNLPHNDEVTILPNVTSGAASSSTRRHPSQTTTSLLLYYQVVIGVGILSISGL